MTLEGSSSGVFPKQDLDELWATASSLTRLALARGASRDEIRELLSMIGVFCPWSPEQTEIQKRKKNWVTHSQSRSK